MLKCKQYLKLVHYYQGKPDECWAVDYISPNVGMTVKFGVERAEAEAFLNKMLKMSDADLYDALSRRGRLERVDLADYASYSV